MKIHTLFSLSAAALALSMGAAVAKPAQLDAAGELIYRGSVFARTPGTAPLFTYERWVGSAGARQSAAHVTRTPGGDIVITEQAQFTPGYVLHRFDAVNRQQGYSGSVVLSPDGRHLEYRLVENGQVTTATEEVEVPVVSGPSLHGFVLQHWEPLVRGDILPVRMIVLARKTTYAFDIRRADSAPGQMAFSITPGRWWLRLAIDPLTVTFDATTRNVVRYEGRVPPMRDVGGKLQPLDARVEYAMAVATYR